MKVRIIRESGLVWDFDSVKEARPFVNKKYYNDYDVQILHNDGRKIRVYDDRAIAVYEGRA